MTEQPIRARIEDAEKRTREIAAHRKGTADAELMASFGDVLRDALAEIDHLTAQLKQLQQKYDDLEAAYRRRIP